MKKSFLFLLIIAILAISFSAVGAQSSDETTEDKDYSDYYKSYDTRFALLDNYQEDLDAFHSGKTSTETAKWKKLREDLRWDAAVTCGYVMSVKEPPELSDYETELLYSSYYQLTAVELYIQSINNGNDETLFALSQQMAQAAKDLEAGIVR